MKWHHPKQLQKLGCFQIKQKISNNKIKDKQILEGGKSLIYNKPFDWLRSGTFGHP